MQSEDLVYSVLHVIIIILLKRRAADALVLGGRSAALFSRSLRTRTRSSPSAGSRGDDTPPSCCFSPGPRLITANVSPAQNATHFPNTHPAVSSCWKSSAKKPNCNSSAVTDSSAAWRRQTVRRLADAPAPLSKAQIFHQALIHKTIFYYCSLFTNQHTAR